MSQRHAFTMVELLVVISIIVLLMGILIPSIGYMNNRAAITKTQARITEISGAIGSYQSDKGQYPLQNTKDVVGLELFNTRINPDDPIDELYRELDNRAAISAGLANEPASIDQGNFGLSGSLVESYRGPDDTYDVLMDSWGEPIFYQPWTAYLDVTDAVNPDSFQLWSFGPNMENDILIDQDDKERAVGIPAYDDSLPYGDDIVNWES